MGEPSMKPRPDAGVRCAYAAGDRLGESPVWDERAQRLYWLEMGDRALGGDQPAALQSWSPASGDYRRWPLPGTVGCFALREAGGVVLAMDDGVHLLDLADGRLRGLATAPWRDDQRQAGLRSNDGRCDRQGRFWFGQAQRVGAADRPLGALSRHDGATLRGGWLPGIGIANGLAFSPAGDRLYYGDAARRTVYVCDYDIHRGEPGPPRLFATAPEGCMLDGAAVDAEGGYWQALFGAGRLRRYTPDGRVEREIRLPTDNPTMLAFGGPDLRTLYITTATLALRAPQPLAGAVLAVAAPVPGLPEPRFIA